MSKTKLHPAEQYAQQVFNGEVLVCEYVTLAIKRYYNDLENALDKGWYFDRKAAQRAISFIEKLGIAHNGHGVVDVLPETLDPEVLKTAVDALFENYPAGAVSLYLHMFQNQTEEGWPELQEILDNDPRVTIR